MSTACISTPDAPSIYDIPKVLHSEGLDAYVVRKLGLPFRDVDWTVWGDLLDRVHSPRETVEVALVGKYVDLPDAYLSVTEALRAGGFAHRAKVNIRWVPSDECETEVGAQAALRDVDAVLIPGGFGIRGIEGKVGAIGYARHRGIPLLGLCLGLQCVVIEAARSVGIADANSAEFEPDTENPVISTMADQEDVVAGEADLGGTMRLGAYPATLKKGSVVAQAYGTENVSERHRHRFEVNNSYRDRHRQERAGLLRYLAGRAPGRVRRIPGFGAPVLRRHPGASGAQEPPDPPASAVRGADQRRVEIQTGRTPSRRLSGGRARGAARASLGTTAIGTHERAR